MQVLLYLFILFSAPAFAATETVTVSWTPAVQPAGVEIDHFVIHYTDSLSTAHQVMI